MPLHLEEHLDVATIVGSDVPVDLPDSFEWRFDDRQPGWEPYAPRTRSNTLVEVDQTEDALGIVLAEADGFVSGRFLTGAVSVDVPAGQRGNWGYLELQARTSNEVSVGVVGGGDVRLITDGSIQTYRLRADTGMAARDGEEDLGQRLIISISAPEPARLDLLAVRTIPKEATYAADRVGVIDVLRGTQYRRALYSHAPARLEYVVRIPDGGRLDVGLGAVRDNAPVRFRVSAHPEGGDVDLLLDETYADAEHWGQRSVDLSHLAGQTVTLTLEAESDRVGTVALWAAPTLSGTRRTAHPNVIFYIIDAAGADFMSVYGYNRRTTPYLERLAAEGAVFEHAYSNSSWTQPSTPSFLTSLQHSVLGGSMNGRTSLPEGVLTMAQHFHRAGYQTAGLTTNPNAGTMSHLERGTDLFREAGVERFSLGSSLALHEDFWGWRDAYPAEPYWAHFQTTEVHAPYQPVAPFAGLFITPERRETYNVREREIRAADPVSRNPYSTAFEDTGIDRRAHFSAARDLYDETMAYQDSEIGHLVERLKASGEWEHTLLVIAADHGQPGAGPDVGIGTLDELPPEWSRPWFRSSVSHIPLIFVWPEQIAPGQRFTEPVSMIDALPTILDLAGLPMPEVMQGQSLAPLLRGEPGWEPRPVILEELEYYLPEAVWTIEVIDGRWGASLEIHPPIAVYFERYPGRRRPAPLLLYDLWNDPQALHSLHEERPDLVEKYTAFLEAQWETHQALAQHFARSEDSPLTPEQLRTLRALGYIR